MALAGSLRAVYFLQPEEVLGQEELPPQSNESNGRGVLSIRGARAKTPSELIQLISFAAGVPADCHLSMDSSEIIRPI